MCALALLIFEFTFSILFVDFKKFFKNSLWEFSSKPDWSKTI